VKLTLGQSRVVGLVFLVLGVGWIAWEESARAGYVASPPVTGVYLVLIVISVMFLFFYPRSLKRK
jgi:hypothetical protein